MLPFVADFPKLIRMLDNAALVIALSLSVVLAGCSLVRSDEEATLSIRFTAESTAQAQPDFRVTFTDGTYKRTLTPSDFEPVGELQLEAGPFDTATSGTLRVECAVRSGVDDAIVKQGTTLPLRSDWRYGLNCAVGPINPSRRCFGCAGFEVTPLSPAQGFAVGDSLFLVWAGTSISNPVSY